MSPQWAETDTQSLSRIKIRKTTDADAHQLEPMSTGLTCVMRYLPILPEDPGPTPHSSPHAQGKTPPSQTVPSDSRKLASEDSDLDQTTPD